MITTRSNNKTRLAILLAAVLKEPFTCLYTLLPFFLLRDLSALSLQIAILTTLKPVSSFFSFYYSELISRKAITLKRGMLLSGLLARIGFIPALLTDNASLYILGSTIYMIFSRAEIPAWMEIIKKNVSEERWQSSFSLGSVVSYSSGMLLTLLFASYVDVSAVIWKSFFALSLLLGAVGVLVQSLLVENDQQIVPLRATLKQSIFTPIKDAFSLMKEKKDFRRFQWSFMIGGFGLMIIQPVIPIYFSSVLDIKYSDLMVAFCVCKALGFVVTTPVWSSLLKKIHPSFFVLFVLFGFALFSFGLIFSSISINCIFLAYLVFGVAQAGSHLIWHLSGPLFSGEESSSRYSGVNIVMVGVRGLVGPLCGWLLLFVMDPIMIFALSMLLSLGGGIYYSLEYLTQKRRQSI